MAEKNIFPFNLYKYCQLLYNSQKKDFKPLYSEKKQIGNNEGIYEKNNIKLLNKKKYK